MLKYLLFMLLMTLPVFACAAKMKQPTPPLQVVSYVDLNKYFGTWYEIARFPNRFQEGCVGTSAHYTLLQDGKIGVLNQCRKGSLDGEISSAKGKAWVVDRRQTQRSRFLFSGPFRGIIGSSISEKIMSMLSWGILIVNIYGY